MRRSPPKCDEFYEIEKLSRKEERGITVLIKDVQAYGQSDHECKCCKEAVAHIEIYPWIIRTMAHVRRKEKGRGVRLSHMKTARRNMS